jgi:hypothetical protein
MARVADRVRVWFGRPADRDLRIAGLRFLAFVGVFLEAALTLCAGRFTGFGRRRAAVLFARRFGLRTLRVALFAGWEFFFRRFSISRSFF